MPSAWYAARQRDLALRERRQTLLGRSRAGALVGVYALIAVTVAMTAILFAALVHPGFRVAAAPQMVSIQDSRNSLLVVQVDPLPRSHIDTSLSAPGRIVLNGIPGGLVTGAGLPLPGEGSLSPGDTLQVCTVLPALSVEMVLRDHASGVVLKRHTFLNPPVCAL